MKVQTIHGVPYYINEKNEVFFYERTTTTTAPPIGVWNASTGKLTLHSNWETLVKDQVLAYREHLLSHTRTELQKAKELQKV